MQRLTSLCYSLVDVPSLFFCVYYRSGKAPVDCVEGAFSCKRSSHWDHQAPVNWTFIWYLCRSSGWTYCFNKEFISQRWGARFNEPLPGLKMRDMKQTVCSQPECLLPSPVCCREHTRTTFRCLVQQLCCHMKPVQGNCFSTERPVVYLYMCISFSVMWNTVNMFVGPPQPIFALRS